MGIVMGVFLKKTIGKRDLMAEEKKRVVEVNNMRELEGLITKEPAEMPNLDEIGDLLDDFYELRDRLLSNHRIDPNLYIEYDVKRGLRDAGGKGVLTGLTEISDVCAYRLENGIQIPADGCLYYQGVNVKDLVEGLGDRKFGFEETIYLLIFGKLPSQDELDQMLRVNEKFQDIGARFVRDVIMKASNENIMNSMQRCVLTLYSYDSAPDDISPENVLRQSLELINKIPLIAV